MKKIKLSVLWIARAAGLFRLCRSLTRSKIRILCYHGGNIGDENRFNPLLFCSAAHLDARIKWLREQGFNIIPLDEAVAMMGKAAGRPSLATVLTFDDGWHSTYRELLPVLEAYGVPSTLYLCTEFFQNRQPIPAVVAHYLVWKAEKRQFELKGFGEGVDGRYDLRDRSAREALISRMIQFLNGKKGERAGACAAIEDFATALGVGREVLDLDSRRFDYVSPEELARLASLGCSVELHGHVHRYPVGHPDELKADLAMCRTIIREQGLPEGRHYCYPSGDYDDQSHAALDEIGVRSATTCVPGLIDVASGAQTSYLPRFLDGERIHDLEFEAEMSGFSDFVRALVKRS